MLPWDDPNHDVMGDLVAFKKKWRDSYMTNMNLGGTYVAPKLIIWLDPGGTTGMAAFWTIDSGIDKAMTWERAQMPCTDGYFLKAMFKQLQLWTTTVQPFIAKPRVHIGYETFDYRMTERYRDKIDYTAAEVIGALKYWAVDRDYVKLIPSGAGLGKGFWTDNRIKQLHLWVPGQGHAMDATRHLLRYRSFSLGEKHLFDPFRPTDVEVPPDGPLTNRLGGSSSPS
jgi:hypothetical protein